MLKKAMALILALGMGLTLAACGGPTTPADSSGSSAPASGSGGTLTEWEQSSGIYNGDETEDELYQKALDEGGTVTIYSISSRIETVAEAFEKAYPGMKVEAYDLHTNELMEKFTREYEAGVHNVDVLHMKDMTGSYYKDYVSKGVLYNYKPTTIMSHIAPEYQEYFTPLYIEASLWFYNTETYPDGCPIDSWWDLTRPEYAGLVAMQSPLEASDFLAILTTLTLDEYQDQLTELYKSEFGKDLVLDDDCPNAGYQLIKNLFDNDPVLLSSNDEVAEAVGTRGQKTAPFGWCASSKMRKIKDNNWAMEVINLKPFTCSAGVNTLYIPEGCKHPASAKLLIRFMMGGDDGTSTGYTPWNTNGCWPVRDDIQPTETRTMEECGIILGSPLEVYDQILDVTDFLTILTQS